jgi:serine/threonine protein kinase
VTSGSTQTASQSVAARYDLLRPLGEGATGAVFLALDRETGEEVALKKLLRLDQRNVLRLKREFRSLADLNHRNLVKLYDLQQSSDAAFLTMEFVDGADLQRELIQPMTRPATHGEWRATDSEGTSDPTRIARVAQVFHQLAHGVRALHQAGLLHRDLKPSNAMITKTGRAVVLDFGLVRRLDGLLEEVTLENAIAGTPAYMPPEQALGVELSTASDWYAFGVMLYETLCGELPIDGRNSSQLIQHKIRRDPRPLPSEAAPLALAKLCHALLDREADNRPRVDEILGVLAQFDRDSRSDTGGPDDRAITSDVAPAPAPARPLFGRDAELDQLHRALRATKDGRSVVVHVRGTSGAGKSALVERFLYNLQDTQNLRARQPVVLRSRCYEREAMPFKALDGVIDALVSHLSQLDEVEAANTLPVEVHALTQVFPVFERLPVVQRLLSMQARTRAETAPVARHRAEKSLRELFTRIARQRALVVWIDDLQWGDLDSASMIQEWLKRPPQAQLLLIFSYRSEELSTSSCLRALITPAIEAPSAVTHLQLDITPLPDAEVEALCAQRLSHAPPALTPSGIAERVRGGGSYTSAPAALRGGAWSQVIARIVREAQGNPFLALQLAALAHAKVASGEVDLDGLSVEELVVRTSALLPQAARSLLGVLAIAGRPLVPQLALGAAGIVHDGRSQIHALQGLRLLRSRHVDGVRLLEVYHDRVREAVQASLTDAQRERIHERLLRVLETSGRSDPDWLHELALGAGQRVLALRYGILAAEIASSSLAFERAAEMYARCLTLAEAPSELASLNIKYGLALARCRRGAQAARAYLHASQHVDGAERLPLLQLAASHLLRSGRYEEGERLVQRVLEALQIDVPKTRARYYAAIGWERAKFAWHARSTQPRPDTQDSSDLRRRVELYGTLAIETQAYAPLRAVLFQARMLRMAARGGESAGMARALCLSATLACLPGSNAAARRSRKQLELAQAWAKDPHEPSFRLELLTARAICAMLLGRAAEVIEPANEADELYEQKSAGGEHGDYYYMFMARAARLGALQALGRHVQGMNELRELLSHARATDNRTAVLQVTLGSTWMEQVLERCASSRARLDRERAELPQAGVGVLHALHMSAVLRAACMTGEYDWADAVVARFWQGWCESPVQQSAYLKNLLLVSQARMLLNRHVECRGEGSPEALVKSHVRWIASKAPEPLRASASSRLRARLSHLRGDAARAAELFRTSAEQHDAIGVLDDAARERYALGCVLGGDQGRELKQAALSALRELGVLEPAADLRGYYPEFFR